MGDNFDDDINNNKTSVTSEGHHADKSPNIATMDVHQRAIKNGLDTIAAQWCVPFKTREGLSSPNERRFVESLMIEIDILLNREDLEPRQISS
jgi:hypothetical protein